MEVLVWRGDWSLPSVDFKCLQLMTLVKLSGAPAKIIKTDFSFGGSLPAFSHHKKKLHEFEHVLQYLNDKNHCPDLNLTGEQLAESFALRKMMDVKLRPALIYIWWIDEKNYIQVTRPWYAKVIPFPLNYYYPGRYKRENEHVIHSLFRNLDVIETQVQIFQEAEKCITCLSDRLGAADYFYGDCPSSLDAVAYGYLAPLLKSPFPSNVLQGHINACPNLVRFVSRITQRYFSREFLDYENKTQEDKKSSSDSITIPNKTRNQVLATAFAAIAMLSFGIFTGIFSFTITSTNKEKSSDYIENHSD